MKVWYFIVAICLTKVHLSYSEGEYGGADTTSIDLHLQRLLVVRIENRGTSPLIHTLTLSLTLSLPSQATRAANGLLEVCDMEERQALSARREVAITV